jgi:hypothetical protein
VKQYTLGRKLDASRLLEFSYFSGFFDDSLVSKWGEPVISASTPSKPEAVESGASVPDPDPANKSAVVDDGPGGIILGQINATHANK